MTTKSASGLFLSLLLLFAFVPSIIPSARTSDQPRYWALIISGSTGLSFSNNTEYMYHVLSQHYIFNGIYYLDVDTNRPGVNASATIDNVRWAITDWLANHSGINDIIFIYFTSHGGGYHINRGWAGGRVEFTSDEGNEVRESTFREGCWVLNALYDIRRDGVPPWDWVRNFDADAYIEIDLDSDGTIDIQLDALEDLDGDGWSDDIFLDPDRDDCCDIAIDADVNHDGIIDNFISDGEDVDNDGYIVGVDLNSDGDFNDWVGIDECMQVQDGWYWDDELASDLNTPTLSYAKLVFVRQGCVGEGEGCFGGGLIDDISATNRIIMSATNETHHSIADMDGDGEPGDGYSEWSEAFIDALHGERTHWDWGVHDESPHEYVDADLNDDGKVSMEEAWDYAWAHDDARLLGWETPWLDDDGNRLPTYINEGDTLDPDDGSLAATVWFPKRILGDVNGDREVDMADIVLLCMHAFTYPGRPRWLVSCDITGDRVVDMMDVAIACYNHGKMSADPPSVYGGETTVSVCPNQITVYKNETFSVNVTIANVTDLYGYEFRLYYNITVLNCTGVELPLNHFLEPVIDPDNIVIVRLEYDNAYNATHGRVWVAVCLIYPELSGKNGSGVLATINFNAKTAGSSALNFYKTKLVDTSAKFIPITVVDGSVTAVLPSLTVLAEDQYDNPLTTGDVYIDGQLVAYTGSTFDMDVGTHEVFVNDFWEAGQTGYRYGFTNWKDGPTSPEWNITVVENTTITAYFFKKWCPGDVDGSGKVDMMDFSIVCYYFGKEYPDP